MQVTTSPESKLLRVLGTWGLAASIVNVTVGGGIFRLPAPVAASLGPAAPIAYLVCSIAMGLIVLSMAQAASRVSLTGGPYAYVEVAFGRFVGFQAGIQLWLLGTLAQAAVSTIFAESFV
jgi:amino acid transporter